MLSFVTPLIYPDVQDKPSANRFLQDEQQLLGEGSPNNSTEHQHQEGESEVKISGQDSLMGPRSRGTFRKLWRIMSRSRKLSLAGGITLFALVVLELVFNVSVLEPAQNALCSRAPDASARLAREQMLLESRPRPLVVVAAGLPRTGSTWVYNVLRILLRMRDPNSIAGWYADLMAIWRNHKTHRYDNMQESWLEAYQSLGTSLLIKTHGPGAFRSFSRGRSLGVGADLTVLTHRDLRTEVRSWVYQNWNNSIHTGRIADTPFGDPAQWVRVAQKILHERNSTLNSIGTGNYIDIRYEDWGQKGSDAQLPIVRALADKLEWTFTDEELRSAILEAKRIFPPADGARLMYNPVSKLHPGHTRIDANNPDFVEALRAGYEAIEQDEITGDFLRSEGYM